MTSYSECDVLQGNGSDVRLIIPKGIACAVIGHVHTYTQDILKHIPDGECLIAPIPEYSCTVKHKSSEWDMFQIRIRHCAGHRWNDIIVRCGDVHNGIPFTQMPKKATFSPGQGNHYTVGKKFIYIYISHFCQFLCTICGEECRGEIQALLFGCLFKGNKGALVHVSTLYLCGPLYSIKDFRKVCTLWYFILSAPDHQLFSKAQNKISK